MILSSLKNLNLSLIKTIGLLTLLLSIGLSSPSQADDDPVLTMKQQEAIRKQIHDYILENPSIIFDAIDAMRVKEELISENNAKIVLTERKEEIFNDPDTPVLGTPKGDIVIVYFYDYRCPYCKGMVDTLFSVVETSDTPNDKEALLSPKVIHHVRLLMKELPLLGPESILAAKASLASRNQKHFEAFHRALMHFKGPINEKSILKIAQDIGMNSDQLRRDMDNPKTSDIIRKNNQLARALNISATPAFVIGNKIIPGALSENALKQLLEQTPSSNKK
jgi:protein-disulfide isomerase